MNLVTLFKRERERGATHDETNLREQGNQLACATLLRSRKSCLFSSFFALFLVAAAPKLYLFFTLHVTTKLHGHTGRRRQQFALRRLSRRRRSVKLRTSRRGLICIAAACCVAPPRLFRLTTFFAPQSPLLCNRQRERPKRAAAEKSDGQTD